MSRSRSIAVFGVLGSFFAAFTTWLLAGWGGPETTQVVSDIGSLVAGGVAAICAAAAARGSRGRERTAWAVLTLALAGWFLGDALWAYYELIGAATAPFPSPADAAYLVFPVAASAALVLLPVGTTGLSQTRLLLDGITVAGSLFMIIWTIGLEDVVRRGHDTPLAVAVSLAYPIGDIVLLTTATLMLTRARRRQRAALAVFAVAATAMALSDGAFVILQSRDQYVSGNIVDIGWIAGLLLMGAAATTGLRTGRTALGRVSIPSRTASWLPYLPLPIATVCVVAGESSPTMMIVAFAVVSSVLVRQFLVADENRRLLMMVSEQALRDPLTGLANRVLFRDRLVHALERGDAHGVAVLTIDLDDFKLVNDSMGHPAGDALLTAIAERITSSAAVADTVARIGGDEFAVLVENGSERPLDIAHRFYSCFTAPFVVEGRDVFVRPSVGVAVGVAGTCAETAAETVLRQADLAMYTAKRSRYGGVALFTSDMHVIDPAEIDPPRDRPVPTVRTGDAGLRLFAQLRSAIDNGELSAVYQPKFSLATGQLAGAEALVRWVHAEHGLLMPAEFLPLAQQNGLMGALTDAVVHRAVCDATAWRVQGAHVPISVNLFAPSLVDVGLPERLARLLDHVGLPAGYLTVEVTEHNLLGNTERARIVLEMLQDRGIRVSIDDFGIGYSDLSHLRGLPVDELKLDPDFTAPIVTDERAEAIVRAVIDLTHRLAMTCVAEGVEDPSTATLLAIHGCDVIQGLVCSPPVEASHIPNVRPLWMHTR